MMKIQEHIEETRKMKVLTNYVTTWEDQNIL